MKNPLLRESPEASERSRNVDLGETGCTAAGDRGTPEKAEGEAQLNASQRIVLAIAHGVDRFLFSSGHLKSAASRTPRKTATHAEQT
jgi:hypothetical protein